jgi:adenylate kinase
MRHDTEPPSRILLLGRQGSGKGTQGAALSLKTGIPRHSAGELLRAAAEDPDHPRADLAALLAAGALVPDDLVLDTLRPALLDPAGFILDGYPRTALQARQLIDLISPRRIDLALYLDVPRAVVVERIAHRRICLDCGRDYPNAMASTVCCDRCGGRVAARPDDTPAALDHRLQIAEQSLPPLLVLLDEQTILQRIDGVGTPEVVAGRVCRVIHRGRCNGSHSHRPERSVTHDGPKVPVGSGPSAL